MKAFESSPTNAGGLREGDLASRKPRLVICGHTYSIRGNRAKAVALSEWFDVMVCAPDCEGILIYGRDGSFFDRIEVEAGYEYKQLRRWPRNLGLVRFMMLGFWKALREWSPDFILCEGEPWSFLRGQTRVLSWILPKRPVFVEFTWENIRRPAVKGLILDAVYKLVARTTDGVVAGNNAARELLKKAGLDEKRILVTGQLGISPSAHPVFSADSKKQWRLKHGFGGDAFVVGFCGRFIPEKGIMELIEAVRKVRENYPRLELALLGSGSLLTEISKENGFGKWFRVIPPVPFEEVASEIGCFDMMILPSKPQLDPRKGDIWEEQFGHVLIESMASGVPTLGSSSGAIPEVLEDSDVIFQWGSSASLAEKIARWLSNPEELELLAIRQRSRTNSKWTHRELAKRYADFMLGLGRETNRK